jgi:hypothetical protein
LTFEQNRREENEIGFSAWHQMMITNKISKLEEANKELVSTEMFYLYESCR